MERGRLLGRERLLGIIRYTVVQFIAQQRNILCTTKPKVSVQYFTTLHPYRFEKWTSLMLKINFFNLAFQKFCYTIKGFCINIGEYYLIEN